MRRIVLLKKYNPIPPSLVFVVDLFLVAVCWLSAYGLRFYFPLIPVTKGIPTLGDYLYLLPIVVAVHALCFRSSSVYYPLSGRLDRGEYLHLLKSSFFAVLALLGVTFFWRDYSYSRVVMIQFWVLTFLSLWVFRLFLRKAFCVLRQRGYRLKRVLIVGTNELAQSLAQRIERYPELGLEIVGFLASHPDPGLPAGNVLGCLEDLQRIVQEKGIDQLYLALPLEDQHQIEEVMELLGEEMVDIKVAPDFLRFMRLNAGIEELDGLPIINLSEGPLFGGRGLLKRGMDMVFSLLALAFLSPLILLIALLVKLTSRGPVFYRQERMGLDGKVFYLVKFRSMRIDAEQDSGAAWTRKNDERRTPWGAFLRSTSLDELPQLLNVLKGDMSLVGPRPERPVFVQQFKKTIPQYMLRHKMKAGITGWAQVNGWRGNTSLEKRIQHDLYYIEHWSLLFDLRILLQTLWRGLVNKNAY